jgi:hypothetical protein
MRLIGNMFVEFSPRESADSSASKFEGREAGGVMAASDFNPLSYFRELDTLPRAIFFIGCLLLPGSLAAVGNRLPVVLLGFGLILFAVGLNFVLNCTAPDPYTSRPLLVWGNLLQGVLAFALAAAFFYVAAYTYREGALPLLRP